VPEAEIELAADPASVAAARRFVGDFLRGVAGDDDWAAVQLVSELATNAIVHAGTPFRVRVVVSPEKVRIEVTDRNPGLRAVQRHYADDATTGRGLGMIEMIAESWGVDQRPGSKTVWCELLRADVARHPDDDGPDGSRPATESVISHPVAGPAVTSSASGSPKLQAIAA